MFCSKCGTRLEPGAGFCTACGAAVTGPLPPATFSPAAIPPANLSPAVAAGAPPAYAGYPAAVALPSPYAGFWLRFVAYLIDAIVLSVVYGVLFLIGIAMVGVESLQSMARGMENGDAAPSAAFIMMMISVLFLGTIASWLYYAYLESSVNQGTLGKMALGLIVTDLQGRRITFGRATGRFFAKIITGLIPLAIGYIMAGFTEKKQALHDMIVSTLVLRKN
jgi:uncharacterized RDD family membrane protein YckC